MSARSNTQFIRSGMNSLLEASQGEENDNDQGYRSLKDIAIGWLPTDFHTLLYGVLTVICTIYAVCTGNGTMLVALWTAAAGYIGVNTTNSLVHTFKGSSQKKTRTRKPPKAE